MGGKNLKKFTINIVLILVAIIIYFLQENFFHWFTIAGIMPNLFIIFVLFIGLFVNRTMGTIYGVIIGLVLDCLVETKIGINAISLGIVGLLAGIFDKNFSKDSRMTIMIMVSGMTILLEIVQYFLNYVIFSINVEIFSFIKILIIEAIYNIIITIIVYPLIKKFGYYIENEYKGNKILTRYF